jgi:hypothetical protein
MIFLNLSLEIVFSFKTFFILGINVNKNKNIKNKYYALFKVSSFM